MNTFPIHLLNTRCLPAVLTLLPFSLALTGCNSSSSSDTATASSTSSTAVAQTSATTEATATSQPKSPARTAVKTTKPAAAKSSTVKAATVKAATGRPTGPSPYRVVDEVPAGAPPDVAQAIQSAKVPPPPATPVAATVRVRLVTSKGPIVLALNGKAAPHHVRSFVYLSRRGFYNGTIFHRYADLLEGSGQGKGPIIQGGDPLSRKTQTLNYAGLGGPGYQVPRERNSLKHDRLVIAAARSQDPDSAGSQCYITQAPVHFLDEGDGYTVFGKVVEGAANALKLAQNDKVLRVEVLK